MRHILKHLRRKGHTSAYRSLVAQSGVQLEHPTITELYEQLVLHGGWTRAEQIFRSFSEQRLFDSFILSCEPRSRWKRLRGTTEDGRVPSKRGGHAMCFDAQTQQLYLFGGWDGERSLADLWRYDRRLDQWVELVKERSQGMDEVDERSPPGRSIHRIAFNARTGDIYVFGGLLTDNTISTEPEPRDTSSSAPSLRSELWRYHTRDPDSGGWERVMFDTAVCALKSASCFSKPDSVHQSQNGPSLIYNHQMVVDDETQMLYVFGGRIVDGDPKSHKYSGLYAYDMQNNLWKSLQYVAVPSRIDFHLIFSQARFYNVLFDVGHSSPVR
jgi:muskelin